MVYNLDIVKERYKKNELARDILKIAAGIALVGTVLVLPGTAALHRFYKAKEYREKKRVYQALEQLRSKKYISIFGTDNDKIFKITSLGLKKLIEFDYDNISIPKPRKWDKKWRIVIFDIPEKKQKVRKEVSFKLKDIGFLPLQKSTFLYPYDCEKEIAMIKKHWGLGKEVSFIVADYIDEQKKFAREFEVFN